ncbi:uncharacterized protein LOC122571958 isoform X4 [Bombus pyrosoma]|uniref:uncharacterized protein LOC122571958 isoform X4 n=1 Tax=Bombus pyrosoma TaxID=396416 RepID=UPI001CB91CC1|nr:uncharacterized protein LOC122571958 isoform X4 [Bombus pyrosoma]
MENIEMERKIEGNDSSIVLSIPLDDSLCSQQTLEPVVARSTVSSSPCLELPIEICQSQSSLDIEPETCTNLGSDVTSPVQLSKRREKVALARRAPNKCKLKSFCTRGHYFRRCLFGKKSHGDVKKAIKVKPSFRERFQESDAVRSSGRGMEQLQQLPRRYSIEKSSKSRIKGCSSLNSRQTDAPVSSMKEDDVLSNLIRSSKDFISAEVFHRGSRRLSRSSRGSISAGSSNISDTFGSYLFNWLPTKLTRESADRTINDKKATPSATPEPSGCRSDQERELESRPESKAESKAESKPEESETEQQPEETIPCNEGNAEIASVHEEETRQEQTTQGSILSEIEKEMANVAAKVDKEKIKQLVSTEINLEKQLENVQRQLLALKQLPSEIESHLRIVSEQLQKIMELSGVQNGATDNDEGRREAQEDAEEVNESEERHEEHEELEETEEHDVTEYTEDISYSAYSDEHVRIVQASEEDDEETETQELEGTLSVKSEEGSRVKKFVVSYETKVLKSPSPAPSSHGSFEPDPNLSAKDQVIQELQQRVKQRGRKRSQDLWPQAKQVELTRGRRWRCPNDFFNDEMIAEVLSSQAEVIRGRALGVNFKKYEKTNLPNYDHLMNSSVYKMIHKMEREPKRGIPARPAKVNAAEDIIERVKSPALSIADDRSTRSVSH